MTEWLVPEWPVAGIGALMTTRQGGSSAAPFDSLNLKPGIGDDDAAVARNQARFTEALGGARPVWLRQVHGARVVRLTAADLGAPMHDADASLTTERGIACTVQVADCLPVLFAAPGGVAAAHAGWRGLAGGVLEATVAALREATGEDEVHAWLGACIGPAHFEVGDDVLQAFGAGPGQADPARFRPDRPGKWLADLPQLARDRLQACAVRSIGGGAWCTVADASRFFSFRRDRVTGRMAAAVWRT
jgi:YfiH family protein